MQKLAWTLDDAKHDYAAVEVAVLPPFTDIRSVQTLVDGDRRRGAGRPLRRRARAARGPRARQDLLIRTLAESLDLSFSRIQFTPDLMPGDIIGTNIIVEDAHGRKQFQFQRGPDLRQHPARRRGEPRDAEDAVGAARRRCRRARVTVVGHANPLPQPFFVLATQNPIEMEGTYPLPEAQLDRFLFKLRVQYPALEELIEIIDRTTHVREIEVQPGDDRTAGDGISRARARDPDRVARAGSGCPHRARHPSPVGARAGNGAPIRPLRREPARGAGARPRRQGARIVRRALQRQRGRPARHRAARAASPAHPELRG